MGTVAKMDSDLLSTASGRAGLADTLPLASEAVLRQICINRGLETYDKSREQLEEAVKLLINALNNQERIQQEQDLKMAELTGHRAEPEEDLAISPVTSPAEVIDQSVAYDRSQQEAGQFQEQLMRERAEDKQHIDALEHELAMMREAIEDEDAMRKDTKHRQCELSKRVRELWAVTECEPADKLSFLAEVEAISVPVPDVLAVYEMEMERLTDILPLMEAATRREFILERLRGLANSNAQFSRNNAPQLRQREEFVRELARLNEQLAQALPAFEKKYTRVFFYKGVPYLEQVHKSVQDTVPRDIERAKSPNKRNEGLKLPAPNSPHTRLSPAAQQTINESRFQRALGERALSPRNAASRAMSPRTQTAKPASWR